MLLPVSVDVNGGESLNTRRGYFPNEEMNPKRRRRRRRRRRKMSEEPLLHERETGSSRGGGGPRGASFVRIY